MIRDILATGVSALALTLAAPALAQNTSADAPATPAASAPLPAPTMEFGTWGFDPASLDRAVTPGDDFNAYVNGKWIAANPIPPEYSRFGSFNVLREQSTADVEKLVADLLAQNPAPGSTERRLVDAYQSFQNEAAIDAAGLAPARPYLDDIASADKLDDLIALSAQPGIPSLVSTGVTVDAKDPDSYIVSIGFNGMGLPDRDYYLVDSPRNTEIQTRYQAYLAFLLGQAGYADPTAMAGSVYAFEHDAAAVDWDRTARRNRDLTYHKLSREEALNLAPGFPMATLLQAAKVDDQQQFLVPQIPPSAAEITQYGLSEDTLAGIGGGTPAFMELLENTPLDVIKAFMATRFLSANAAVLPSTIDDANFAFYGTFLSGQPEQRPRWKRAIDSTEGMLGEQLGALYVKRYFPPASKAAMDDLVVNLRKALADSLAQNDWMTPETRTQAEAKLDAFTPKVAYPDEFETYDGLVITPGDALGNRIRSIGWEKDDNRAKLGKPVDRTEWGMLPQTVNAYYNPVFNEIVFPAGILQAPFFDAEADPAVNYGGIGAVIGHEMGHGFDDQGSKYAASGKLENWWEPADRARFDELTDELAAQYDAFCPYDEGATCVNGRYTLGENIGDVGGLSIAYRAYHMSLDGKEAPVIDGLTGDQRFFLAWAQVWRSTQREAAGRQRLLTDPHSPEEFRVNGAVRNQDAWYSAFNVQPGDALYLPPEERVHIW